MTAFTEPVEVQIAELGPKAVWIVARPFCTIVIGPGQLVVRRQAVGGAAPLEQIRVFYALKRFAQVNDTGLGAARQEDPNPFSATVRMPAQHIKGIVVARFQETDQWLFERQRCC